MAKVVTMAAILTSQLSNTIVWFSLLMHSYCTGKWFLKRTFLKAVSLVTSRYTLIETAFIVIIRNDVLPWWKHLYMYLSQLLLAFVVQLIWTASCSEVWWCFNIRDILSLLRPRLSGARSAVLLSVNWAKQLLTDGGACGGHAASPFRSARASGGTPACTSQGATQWK